MTIYRDDRDLLLDSYNFSLPQNLIATSPKYPKESAKLLVYHKNTGEITHTTFASLFDFIPSDYLIVLNDTRVIPARFYASKIDSFVAHDTNIRQLYIKPRIKTTEFLYHKSLGGLRHLAQIRGKVRKNDCFIASDLKTLIQVVRILDDGYKEVSFYDIVPISNVAMHGSNKYIESIFTKSQKFKQNLTSSLSKDAMQCQSISSFIDMQSDQGLIPLVYFKDIESNLCNISPMQDLQVLAFLRKLGKIPLPPYIKREANIKDITDYQSIFASIEGSVAAPTASLHFSESMLVFLKEHFHYTFVTLHIGAGTFAPIKTNSILEHKIHSEYCNITESSASNIARHDKILCVGTTALRCVEWFARLSHIYEDNLDFEVRFHDQVAYNTNKDKVFLSGYNWNCMTQNRALNSKVKQKLERHIQELCGENSLFLHPFNRPIITDALLTNFHLPKSSLLLLVSSLIGREEMLRIYAKAIERRYRFYSYGDGMLII